MKIVALTLLSLLNLTITDDPLNLRARRTPRSAWTVEAAGLTGIVTGGEPWRSHGEAGWTLNVALQQDEGMKIVDASTLSKADTLHDFHHPRADTAAFQVAVRAPLRCELANNREAITVQLRIQEYDAPVITLRVLKLDTRCLLGVVVPLGYEFDPEVERHQHDAVIERIALQVAPKDSQQALTPEAEARMVLNALGGSGAFVPDPVGYVEFPAGTQGYVLSPDETVRFGGDCEDWAILLASYFRHRGVRAEVTGGFGHAWVRVWDADGTPLEIDPTIILQEELSN